MRIRALILCALALLASGCARSIYRWDAYDDRLEGYLKKPDKVSPYMASLDRVMADSGKAGTRVPPGIYAEYGRVLYDKRDYGRAIGYFTREKAVYPESAVLMDRWIANAEKLGGGRQ